MIPGTLIHYPCVYGGRSAVEDSKTWISCHLDLPKDTLHVYIGVLVMLAAALVLRRRVRSWWPFLVVVAVAFIGEMVDVWDQVRMTDPFIRWGDSVHDILNTCALPLLLTLVARFSRTLRDDREQPRE